ncbi:MAG: hypothetical protein V3T43_04690, partial [Nitrosomonadaceae bacterium]
PNSFVDYLYIALPVKIDITLRFDVKNYQITVLKVLFLVPHTEGFGMSSRTCQESQITPCCFSANCAA